MFHMAEHDPQAQLAFAEPGAVEPSPEPAVAAAPAEPTAAELQADLVAAQARESALNERLDQERARFDTFLERSPQPQTPAAPVRVDAASAPDPAIDIEGFNRHQAALSEQQTRDMEARVDARASELEAQQTASNLWSQFIGRYPEHAGREEIATIAFNRLTKGGLPSDTSGLIDSVKAEMDRMIGPAPTASPQPNRTAVAGGSQPPSAPAPIPAESKVSSFADSIFDFQEKAGYI